MAINDLIARLEHDADTQVEAIARAADAEVVSIGAAAERALAARAERSLASERAIRRARFARELADRRRAARAIELAATHAAIERVFARALALLPAVSRSAAWTVVWPALMRDALSYFGGAACRVRCAPDMAGSIRPALGAGAAVEVVEDPDVGPGAIMDALDGSVTVDATLAALLRQRGPRLSIGLLREDARDG